MRLEDARVGQRVRILRDGWPHNLRRGIVVRVSQDGVAVLFPDLIEAAVFRPDELAPMDNTKPAEEVASGGDG